MAGAHHSCPAPSDSSGSSSLPEKGRMIGTGQVVSTLDQVVSTLETAPRKPVVPVWDSVSTLDQTHYLLRRTGVVSDETLVEEMLETDSERGD
ncbi:hypothetical protein Taro_052925 [Colocasia esculenta]|uniref:Uncharacterized protein n=1 Tax=Colocasia esculenta TaxID=4460 RepID=A0A843XL39_COLES|nr:hypothetical protein [Colocasia esculenta]